MDDRRRVRLTRMFRVGVVLLLGHAAFGAVEFLVGWLHPRISMSDEWRLGVMSVGMVADCVGYLLLVRPLFAMADLWNRRSLRFAAWISLALGLWTVFGGSVWLIHAITEGWGLGSILTTPDRVRVWLRHAERLVRLSFFGALCVGCFVLARPARVAVLLRASGVVLALLCAYLALYETWATLRLLVPALRPAFPPWIVWVMWFGIGSSALMLIPCVLLWLGAPRLFRRPEEEGLCPVCFYDLGGRAEGGCPECGWGRGHAAQS